MKVNDGQFLPSHLAQRKYALTNCYSFTWKMLNMEAPQLNSTLFLNSANSV